MSPGPQRHAVRRVSLLLENRLHGLALLSDRRRRDQGERTGDIPSAISGGSFELILDELTDRVVGLCRRENGGADD